MVKALPNTSFLPVPKSAPAGHTTAAAHLLWQVFPRYPCLEYKDNSGQSCPVRYTWTASFGCGLMFWQKWFYLTPQFVAYQFPGHLLHPHWYFTAYSSICQVLLGALNADHPSGWSACWSWWHRAGRWGRCDFVRDGQHGSGWAWWDLLNDIAFIISLSARPVSKKRQALP